jgi:hypothetical protein
VSESSDIKRGASSNRSMIEHQTVYSPQSSILVRQLIGTKF